MFASFPLSVGVANLLDFAERLRAWPAYLTTHERGARLRRGGRGLARRARRLSRGPRPMTEGRAPLPTLAVAVALALGTAVSLGLARFSYAMFLPPMRADLGWSYLTAGAMNTSNAAGYLAGALLAPAWMRSLGGARRVPRRHRGDRGVRRGARPHHRRLGALPVPLSLRAGQRRRLRRRRPAGGAAGRRNADARRRPRRRAERRPGARHLLRRGRHRHRRLGAARALAVRPGGGACMAGRLARARGDRCRRHRGRRRGDARAGSGRSAPAGRRAVPPAPSARAPRPGRPALARAADLPAFRGGASCRR